MGIGMWNYKLVIDGESKGEYATIDGMDAESGAILDAINILRSKTDEPGYTITITDGPKDTTLVLRRERGRKALHTATVTRVVRRARPIAKKAAAPRRPVALKATASIVREDDGRYIVNTTWSGRKLDRTDGIGFSCSTKRALAERLAAAINAGKVFTRPTIRKDVKGDTYVSSGCTVLGRTMHADLKRLGF